MINLIPVDEPDEFDARARQPGNKWLAQNTDPVNRPPDKWSPFRQYLIDGQHGLCAYGAMRCIPEAQVDHYLSIKNHRHLAYEWSNYRYSSGLLNNLKANHDDAVLDPYEIENGRFQILLPSLQLICTDKIPCHLRHKASETLRLLKLRDDERILRWRQSIFAEYESGRMTIEGLRAWAPLIAEAVDRRNADSSHESGGGG
jgi:hypothetical protein